MSFRSVVLGLTVGLASVVSARAVAVPAADTVLLGGHIWTATGTEASAMAVREGQIVAIGSETDVRPWIGPKSRVVPLRGRFLMPGLVDAHMHPLDIVDLPVCDLDSRPLSLKDLTAFVRGCLKRYPVPKGGRLLVHQWNYVAGNQPDPEHPTVRAALDLASRDRTVQLLGNDGHHGAFNSFGLAQARSAAGEVVGLSKKTLAAEFRRYGKLVGVDAVGDPNGAVNEDARYTINPHSMMYVELARIMPHPEWVAERLNRSGITAATDAMADPDGMAFWDALYATGRMTFRANLAQFLDPERYRDADGHVNYSSMIDRARGIRAHFAGNPLIRADTVKIFADGVLEGNPLADPPTLPNGAVLAPLLQPRYGTDREGHLTVVGYVDTASPECVAERNRVASAADTDVQAFRQRYGFHPVQCTVSNGQLQHDRDVIVDFARHFHAAGFNLHIHAIGDRAVRTAVDAIEAARKADGNSATRDGLAHVQLAHPDDIARMGRDHLFIAYTFAWANVDTDYDLTLLPFLQKTNGNRYEDLHPADGYYEQHAYPVRATLDAGAVVAAGSDAPVETRDPRPFYNISRALTRRIPGEPALNAGQAIGIEDALRAYTINGARWLGIDAVAGSLAVGKSADFVITDRDPVRLAAEGHPETIEKTRVLSTWFQGHPVYEASSKR